MPTDGPSGPMRGLIDRLFGRHREAPAGEEPPLTAIQRAKLDRQRRVLERNLKHMSKRLHVRGCSTCPTAQDPAGVRLWQQKRMMESALKRIEARLSD